MSFKKNIKQKLFSSPQGTLLFYKLRLLREKWGQLTLSDYAYIKKEYKKRFGREINLKNPQTLSEKLQWLKLFYRNEQMPVCSDKYDLRLFLKKHGYEHLLNEILAVYENNEQIEKMDIESLPQSFVVKATHGSGWNLVVKDKNDIDWKIWKKIFKQWLKLDLSVFGREWNYREVKPRIIIEKFLDYNPLIDYKLTCFNGIPKYFQINSSTEERKFVDFYNLEWKNLEITVDGFNKNNQLIPPPPNFKDLIKIAEKLSEDFPFVRIDFYNFKNEIKIGELTFFPSSGLRTFSPKADQFEQLFGSYLDLPKVNFNLELYKKIKNENKTLVFNK